MIVKSILNRRRSCNDLGYLFGPRADRISGVTSLSDFLVVCLGLLQISAGKVVRHSDGEL